MTILGKKYGQLEFWSFRCEFKSFNILAFGISPKVNLVQLLRPKPRV